MSDLMNDGEEEVPQARDEALDGDFPPVLPEDSPMELAAEPDTELSAQGQTGRPDEQQAAGSSGEAPKAPEDAQMEETKASITPILVNMSRKKKLEFIFAAFQMFITTFATAVMEILRDQMLSLMEENQLLPSLRDIVGKVLKEMKAVLLPRIKKQGEYYILPRSVPMSEKAIQDFDDQEYRRVFRLKRETVAFLVEELQKDLLTVPPQGLQNIPNRRLSVEKQIQIALMRLGQQGGLLKVAEQFGVSSATVSKTFHKVMKVIGLRLHHWIKWPKILKPIKQAFESKTGLVNCVGAISCLRIELTLGEGMAPSDYFDCDRKYSTIIQAVVDHRMNFMDVFLGSPGGMHDGLVLRRSELGTELEKRGKLWGGSETFDGVRIPPYLVGDAKYGLHPNLIAPYPDQGSQLSEAESSFNFHHSSARVAAERAFGKLKSQWRYLLKIFTPDREKLLRTLAAATILHNISIAKGEADIDWELEFLKEEAEKQKEAKEKKQLQSQQTGEFQGEFEDLPDLNRSNEPHGRMVRDALSQHMSRKAGFLKDSNLLHVDEFTRDEVDNMELDRMEWEGLVSGW